MLGAFLFLPFVVIAVQPQDVIISEVAWMGTVASGYDEWIELKNMTDKNIYITNWVLASADGSPNILLRGVIPAFGYFLLERTDDNATSLSANQIYTGSLSNSGEELLLKTTNGEIIDKTVAGSWEAGDNGAHRTMMRDYFSGTGSLVWKTYSGSGSSVTDLDGNLILGTPQNSESPPLKLLISEVSPKNSDGDFIEIYVGEEANLKGVLIWRKNSPNEIFEFEDNFSVNKGDFVTIKFLEESTMVSLNKNEKIIIKPTQKALSAGSEALKIVGADGKTIDFICWQKTKLSQTARSEVEKNIPLHWQGDCVEIEEMIENESIARSNYDNDTNNKYDFFRHFNGSFAKENVSQNNKPEAVITIQGGTRIFKSGLNLTGEDSKDDDGQNDIETFYWTVNDKSCPEEVDGWRWKNDCNDADKENPNMIYFDEVGDFEVCLTVKDFSGEVNKACKLIEVIEKDGKIIIDPFHLGGGTSSGAVSQEKINDLIEKALQGDSEKDHKMSKSREDVSADFFNDFLDKQADSDFLIELAKNPIPHTENNFAVKPAHLRQRDRVDLDKVRGNLGFIFDY